ncbi:MAG TPA: serine hydroxymethyltransferase, partial [Tepidisphaeraceae bacterium]
QTSGVRLGTPALTTRGLKENDLADVAAIIDRALRSKGDAPKLEACKGEVLAICGKFPMKH